MASLTRKEIKKLRKQLKENWRYQIQFGFFSFFIGLSISYIPIEVVEFLFTDLKFEFSGSIQDQDSNLFSLLFIVGWVFFSSWTFYRIRIVKLQKDLKYKKKISTKVELTFVERLKELSNKKKDSILHFDNDEIEVKKVYFNSRKKPEYLKATHAIVEYAVFSKYHFKTKILFSEFED